MRFRPDSRGLRPVLNSEQLVCVRASSEDRGGASSEPAGPSARESARVGVYFGPRFLVELPLVFADADAGAFLLRRFEDFEKLVVYSRPGRPHQSGAQYVGALWLVGADAGNP